MSLLIMKKMEEGMIRRKMDEEEKIK